MTVTNYFPSFRGAPLARARRERQSGMTRYVSRARRSMERSGMVRRRPGIVTNSEPRAAPDQRRTAAPHPGNKSPAMTDNPRIC
jgi:hypothetical protein